MNIRINLLNPQLASMRYQGQTASTANTQPTPAPSPGKPQQVQANAESEEKKPKSGGNPQEKDYSG